MDREQATKHLIEDRLPLITVKIQDCLAHIRVHRGGPPANSLDILDLWKIHPWHFANYIWERTRHKYPLEVLFTTEDGLDFTDNEAKIIRKLVLGYYRYRSYLNSLTHEDFLALYKPFRQRKSAIVREEALAFDLTQFYSFPEADANMMYWRQCPTWELEEFVALAFGKDPRIVDGGKIAKAVENKKSPFADEYFELRQVVTRAYDSGQLKNPLTPTVFATWASQANISLPNKNAFPESLANSHQKTDEETYDKKEVSTAAVHKLYSIMLGMAIARYKFSSDTHGVEGQDLDYRELMRDLHDLGLPVDRSTLSKYFSRAYAFARDRDLFKAVRGKTR